MRVAFGSDHAGFALKEILRAELLQRGHQVADLGTTDAEHSVDYPDFGAAVGPLSAPWLFLTVPQGPLYGALAAALGVCAWMCLVRK